MAVRKTITVSVTPEQHAFLGERVHSGQYGSVSEVVRAALRMLERSEPDFLLKEQARLAIGHKVR
ncbi:type II toxin-antitoxin system ParD family antitoxin [Methylobacterium sp. WL103]|jgi:antitoxin ParD1/3/4|uniref:type II toxin-antitoxin system ParD family antitoxin n=1 Tax=Methylobacterium sp. WL103 TaxID=2603891 RepID=UPI0011CB415C|nr:type II toxin-antitoxin system ParD family antitoxin [Methylobacterium sp. WL103]TXN09146.1 type II toxin-antitoxin system ParD family antitoxin [Methylobacterium sp. WL103]